MARELSARLVELDPMLPVYGSSRKGWDPPVPLPAKHPLGKAPKSVLAVTSGDGTVFAQTGPEPRPFEGLMGLDVEAVAQEVVAAMMNKD